MHYLGCLVPIYGELANVWDLVLGKAEDSLAGVKTGNKNVKTTSAGGYLTTDIEDLNPKQYNRIVVILEGANQFLMLVVTEVTKAGVSGSRTYSLKREILISLSIIGWRPKRVGHCASSTC